MSKKILNENTELINKTIAERISINYDNEINNLQLVEHDFANLDNWFESYIDVSVSEETTKKNMFTSNYLKIAISLVFILGVSVTTLGNTTEAFRFLNFNVFTKDHENHTSISKVEDEVIYNNKPLPVYLPVGMELKEYQEYENMSIAQFESDTHDITLTTSGNNTTIAFDTEDLERINFSDVNGFYVIENDSIRAYWSTESNHFTLVSNLSIAEVVKIIKSID